VVQPPDTNAGYNSIMLWIMSLFAWLLGIAIIVLDYAAQYTVVTMGNYVHNLSAIGVVWNVMRNLGNIALIFGFLAIGVSIILDMNVYGWGQRMIPKLLIAAVLLNFSLFITEAVIDVGNLLATQVYVQINGGVMPNVGNLSMTSGNASGDLLTTNEGISNLIMNKLGLQSIYGDAQSNPGLFKGSRPWFIGFLGILLFIIAAFVMFSLAFVLIFRFVALIFIIILAPLGIVGLAIPKLAGEASQWWHQLLTQTFTAPILFLMLYVALRVIADAQFLTGFGSQNANPSWTAFLNLTPNGIVGFASLLLSFIVAMGLLLAVTMYAKSMSAFGASAATKWASAASFGAAAWGGRATLGGVGRVANSRWVQAHASKGGFGGTLAKATAFTGRRFENRTYDIRNVGAVGGLLSGRAIGVDTGIAAGSALTTKQAVEKVREWNPVSAAAFRRRQKEYDAAAVAREEEKKRETLEKDVEAGQLSPTSEKELASMSVKELEEMKGIRQGIDILVAHLSPQQFEALMKSEKITDVEKGNVKTARYRQLTQDAARAVDQNLTQAERDTARDSVDKALKSLSKGEVEAMPANLLANNAVLEKLSDKQRDIIADSKERTSAERDLVRQSSKLGQIKTAFEADPILGPINAARLIGSLSLSPAQIAKLDKKILTQPMIAAQFRTADLIAIQEEKKLSSTEMTTVGNIIRASGTASQAVKDYINTGPGKALWS